MANNDLFTNKAPSNLPKESWWLDCDRDTFSKRLKDEQERMARSPMGRTEMIMTAPSVQEDARRKKTHVSAFAS